MGIFLYLVPLGGAISSSAATHSTASNPSSCAWDAAMKLPTHTCWETEEENQRRETLRINIM